MARRFYSGADTTVMTAEGLLKGFFLDDVYTFHGIKYADAERFQMPTAPQPWEGVKDATNYGYICPVSGEPMPTGEILIPHRFWPANEHCQYLNIWSPTLDGGAKKPVMVWLHGGGFANGSSIEQVAYEGDALAKWGDVVVVTLNHRLNILGYLDMSSFGEKYRNSVNAGMADIVEALRWIRRNIAAFGGDPTNVTLFGQSGGGGKISALLQIPEAAGLFHKAVLMSGIFEG
ncbi:MAG: carboxylesterase family protein, partial [Oscillospiraceae bacterium]|nr:carboxylesterase family protein [Oscillospiraceae bacterium]